MAANGVHSVPLCGFPLLGSCWYVFSEVDATRHGKSTMLSHDIARELQLILNKSGEGRTELQLAMPHLHQAVCNILSLHGFP